MVTPTNFGQFTKANIETLGGAKQLTWDDSPIQMLTSDGATARTVNLPLGGEHAVGSQFFIANVGAGTGVINIASSSMANGQTIAIADNEMAIVTYAGYEKDEEVIGNVITYTERKWLGGVLNLT